uniref:GH16 domain-containing protein n=1 Tax=Cannabis sativa TaxID=3483 RepID=A0A803QKF2_CANSA
MRRNFDLECIGTKERENDGLGESESFEKRAELLKKSEDKIDDLRASRGERENSVGVLDRIFELGVKRLKVDAVVGDDDANHDNRTQNPKVATIIEEVDLVCLRKSEENATKSEAEDEDMEIWVRLNDVRSITAATMGAAERSEVYERQEKLRCCRLRLIEDLRRCRLRGGQLPSSSTRLGIAYPNKQGMKVHTSLWNADNWSTRGGLVKIDWNSSPFTTKFRRFRGKACKWNGPVSIGQCASNTPRKLRFGGNFAKHINQYWPPKPSATALSQVDLMVGRTGSHHQSQRWEQLE